MLHVSCTGEGPNLVLLHGLFGSLENLGVLSRLFSMHHTVYSFDLPNHGRSPHEDEIGLKAMADRVWSAIQAQIQGPVCLIGHSLGGKIAMEIALRFQDIAGLVVMDIAPDAYPRRHDDIFAGLNHLPLKEGLQRRELDLMLQDYVKEPAVRSFLLKNLARTGSHYSWKMHLADIERSYLDLVGANLKSEYLKPTMFVKGGESEYITEFNRQSIVERFPNAELKIVSGAGHWLHAEKPEQTSGVIERFLNKNKL